MSQKLYKFAALTIAVAIASSLYLYGASHFSDDAPSSPDGGLDRSSKQNIGRSAERAGVLVPGKSDLARTRANELPVAETSSGPERVGQHADLVSTPGIESGEISATRKTQSGPAMPQRKLSYLVDTMLKSAEGDAEARGWLAKHESFEAEERDTVWADQAEQRLENYFAGKAKGYQLEILSSTCHETMCELQMADAQPNHGGEVVGQKILNDMVREPWWSEFEDMRGRISHIDGRTIYLAYLIRRRGS